MAVEKLNHEWKCEVRLLCDKRPRGWGDEGDEGYAGPLGKNWLPCRASIWCYQPIKSRPRCSNLACTRGLVKISAQLSLVWTLAICTVPFRTWSQKWWNLMERCLVLGWLVSVVAMVRHLWLLPYTIDLRVLLKSLLSWSYIWSWKLLNAISWMCLCNGKGLHMHVLRAWYSVSVVLRAISVCSLLVHETGHPQYTRTNPVQERVLLWRWANAWCHLLAKVSIGIGME